LHTNQVLSLLLALSCALNVGFATYIAACLASVSRAKAFLTAGGAVGTVMMIYFAALSAYH
jgi:hypothetical protein